ncbi:hypothetical protein J2T07_000599 [Luteibacter jiangsuensis]|uniref:Restriction endonuclease n=1 Tax=Luteibacter jiangsuensis TaxID=637577 RepID=A0ABT9SUH0_9GAMM|nr:hypothetical protein [Luteibacter jiangsuensis]MDQ0008440.1 hypothetical protein [Luteibacter jiangsuensis]
MDFKRRTISELARMICGDFSDEPKLFRYRSSHYLTEFFQDCDTDYAHDGSTRAHWVAGVLTEILSGPQPSPQTPPQVFSRVIRTLMDPGDAMDGDPGRTGALTHLNQSLSREGFEAFYAEDQQCYLRHIASGSVAADVANPHRPLSAAEVEKRKDLTAFLDAASEDALIEEVLLPLFRQLGFQRITAAGHKDKALEYGKDLWMRYVLPTQHVIYFGIQAKRDKLDASGMSGAKNANVAEIHNQATMMLGHEIFDPEIGKRVLVDHALIVAGGEITKAARNWLGNKLDASRRSQIMFMDREDILNLFVVTPLKVPGGATSKWDDDDIPF